MIEINGIKTVGIENAIYGMRFPMNSWTLSDTNWVSPKEVTIEETNRRVLDYNYYGDLLVLGDKDDMLMKNLAYAGDDHGKFLRFINVYMDITAPLYWWKEYDTYKIGTVANSCSTMHKIHSKKFIFDDFSIEDVYDTDDDDFLESFKGVVRSLNILRDKYNETKDKRYWRMMIQMLPSSYNQRRYVMLNYQTLRHIYHARKNHKLTEWRTFCATVENLPLSYLITETADDKNNV